MKAGSRTSVTYKLELFVAIAKGWKPLKIATKSSILNVTGPILMLQLGSNSRWSQTNY